MPIVLPIALLASLKTLALSSVKHDLETGKIDVDGTVRSTLKVHGLSVHTSIAVCKSLQSTLIILKDPKSYEEELWGSLDSCMIVCCN